MKHFLVTFSAVLGAITVAVVAYIVLDAYGRHRLLEQARYDACNPQDTIDPPTHLAKMKALGFPVNNQLEYNVGFLAQSGLPYDSLKDTSKFTIFASL